MEVIEFLGMKEDKTFRDRVKFPKVCLPWFQEKDPSWLNRKGIEVNFMFSSSLGKKNTKKKVVAMRFIKVVPIFLDMF